MILLAHMLFGAAVGYKTYSLTNNIWLATTLALLSHYFLDVFPHVEYLESVESSMKKIKSGGLQKNIVDIVKVILDFCLGFALVFLFSNNQPLVYIFALTAIIPDGLTVTSNLFLSSNKFLLKHDVLHKKVHFLKYKKTKAPSTEIVLGAWPSIKNFVFNALVSFPTRILTQVLAVLVGIVMLKI